jgi:putative membrane protein
MVPTKTDLDDSVARTGQGRCGVHVLHATQLEEKASMIRTLTLAVVVALATNVRAQETPSVPLGDEVFAMKAYSEGIAEIAKSRLACERATQPGVKEFAERMVRDHTECNNKVAETARKKGIALPTAIDAVHTIAIARLGKLSGSDFDKTYLMAQMCAHKDALHLFSHESHKGEDADLKELAAKALPTLQDHAKMAFELAGEKAEYQKFCKIQEYAKQVMAEK